MNHEHWGTGNQIHSVKLTSLCQLCVAWWNPPVGPLGVTVTQVKNSCVVMKTMMNIYFKNKIHIMTGARQNQSCMWTCIWELLLCDIHREENFNISHKGFVVYLVWSLGNSLQKIHKGGISFYLEQNYNKIKWKVLHPNHLWHKAVFYQNIGCEAISASIIPCNIYDTGLHWERHQGAQYSHTQTVPLATCTARGGCAGDPRLLVRPHSLQPHCSSIYLCLHFSV